MYGVQGCCLHSMAWERTLCSACSKSAAGLVRQNSRPAGIKQSALLGQACDLLGGSGFK